MDETPWIAARTALGLIFLWAFFDKLFGLGFSTCRDKATGLYTAAFCSSAWISGGSPTTGFLKGSVGMFHGVFNGLAGNGVVDWLFMIGLFCIGLALLFGVALKLTAYTASALLGLMWLASLPLATHPFIDDHLVYALVIIGLYMAGIEGNNSIAQWWRSLVRENSWLR